MLEGRRTHGRPVVEGSPYESLIAPDQARRLSRVTTWIEPNSATIDRARRS